ncbi:MAG TPA: glutamate-1-semialdehyde 2,1-aminomutase [Candidatus Acidoferrales bacterium]|nr:glutamate-1-semialdehyde 2,1-aminomutase [Candidatus Acidoferrales bacterium]
MGEIQKTRRRTKSREWFTRAQETLVEGVNSPSRGRSVFSLGPVVLERGVGARVWDVDWNEYIDFMMAFGALIHGHAHPSIVEAATQAMSEGTHFAACTAAEVEAAERVCRMVPAAERVRFTNTGSEATMLALRMARAHTGRTKFLKFEGQYHGWYDPYLLNAHAHPAAELGTPEAPARIPDSAGIPEATFADVVLAPWNDVGALERVFREHGGELAAAITEPVMANLGCIPPRPGYLQRLRELTQQSGALLIFDEVVTGFRYAPGGCQERFGIRADLATFGKALGAGFPIGALAGPHAILDRLEWREGMVLHYGTFNGHRLTMKVVAANLDLLSAYGGAAYKRLEELGEAAIGGLRDVFRRRKVAAIVQGFGPMFQIYFTERPAIHDYREYCAHVDARKYSYFVHLLLERGIYMTPSNGLHWIISTAHKPADIDHLLVVADDACATLG